MSCCTFYYRSIKNKSVLYFKVTHISYCFKMADINYTLANFCPYSIYTCTVTTIKIWLQIFFELHLVCSPNSWKNFTNPKTSLRENLSRRGIFLRKVQKETIWNINTSVCFKEKENQIKISFAICIARWRR